MVITHNLWAMNSQRQFNISLRRIKKSTEKLSSGYKINRSADDAAGLSISEKMRNQIRGLDQAVNNIEDGIGLIQTGEGALNEVHNILQRIGELSVKAANDTNADEDRSNINDEVVQLKEELSDIFHNTKFNNRYLYNSMELSPTTKSNNSMIHAYKSYSPSFKKLESLEEYKKYIENNTLAFEGEWKVEKSGADIQFSYTIKEKIDNSSGGTTTSSPMDLQNFSVLLKEKDFKEIFIEGKNKVIYLNETSKHFPSNLSHYNNMNLPKTIIHLYINSKHEKFTPSKDDLETTDIDQYNLEVKNYLDQCFNALQASGLYEDKPSPYAGTIDHPIYNNCILQTGANAGESLNMHWKNLNLESIGLSSTNTLNRNNAENAINEVQRAIKIVSKERSNFGAIQNRLEKILNNNKNYAENLQSAESNIRDTDIATELMNHSKINILQQISQSMLAQANQNNESVLNLLQ